MARKKSPATQEAAAAPDAQANGPPPSPLPNLNPTSAAEGQQRLAHILSGNAEAELAQAHAQADTEMLHKIQKAKDEVRAKQATYEESKKETAGYKKEMEVSVEKLMRLIEISQEETPLFDGINQAKPAVDLDNDDSWKDTPLSEVFVGLPSGLQKKVADAELVTMNDLTEFLKHKRMTDIKGIGEHNGKRLEEELEAFWERRKQAPPPSSPVLDNASQENQPQTESGPQQAHAEPLEESEEEATARIKNRGGHPAGEEGANAAEAH